MHTVRLSSEDNVVTAISPIETGQEGATGLIPRGHKIALRPIAEGAAVVKYGADIGAATADIAPGDHVHLHNLRGRFG